MENLNLGNHGASSHNVAIIAQKDARNATKLLANHPKLVTKTRS